MTGGLQTHSTWAVAFRGAYRGQAWELAHSLGAEVRVSVDLVAQVQNAVHVSDDVRKLVPQLDLLDVCVAVAAHTVHDRRGWAVSGGGGGTHTLLS